MAVKLFSHTKELETLHTQIKDAQRDMKHLSRRVAQQQEQTDIVLKEAKQHGKIMGELLQKLEQTTDYLAITSKDFEKAATDIALIRPTLEKKIIENFSSTIEQELANATNKIHAQAAGFNATKEVFNKHANISAEALKEVEKLNRVIKSINAADFELEMHAKRLETNDKEKLRLMAEVDKLERMLAKMKRK